MARTTRNELRTNVTTRNGEIAEKSETLIRGFATQQRFFDSVQGPGSRFDDKLWYHTKLAYVFHKNMSQLYK